MTEPLTDAPDPRLAQLRSLVAHMDREVSSLLASEPTKPLVAAWARLVDGLALGPEPELRRCPHCARFALRIATRCRYCMKHSPAESTSAVGRGTP